MNLIENIRQAFNSLFINRKRSFLTMLGIIIGLSAVVTIVSIGNTASFIIEEFFTSLFGGNLIYVDVDYNSQRPDYAYTLEERKYILSNAPDCIIGEYYEFVPFSGEFETEYDNSLANVIGLSSVGEKVKNIRLKEGRFISEEDCIQSKNVIVISDITAENCFGYSENIIGKTVSFNGAFNLGVKKYTMNNEFVIVGVYEYIDTTGKLSKVSDKKKFTTEAYCPYEVELKSFPFIDSERSVWNLTYVVDEKGNMPKAKEYLENIAASRFFGDDGYGFYVQTLDDFGLKDINIIVTIVTGVFVMIAAISLLVGGIGLMNTMLVSVTERTREIGIRKALGAKKKMIRAQFLAESAVICLVACAIGIFCGYFIGLIIESNLDFLISKIPNDTFKYFLINTELHITPSKSAVIVSTAFSLAVGLIFGYYPANKAAKMQPVDALRYE